jgi:hypothetical protein
MQKDPVVAALTTIILLLSGCHSTPTPAVTAVDPTAPVTASCAVLTPAEISEVLGISIDPGKNIPPSSTTMCSWSQTGVTGEAATKFVLSFATPNYFQKEKTPTNPRVVASPATGIGDEAYYVTSEFGISLFVRKGSTAVGFSIHDKTLPADQLKTKEKALALKAVTRL